MNKEASIQERMENNQKEQRRKEGKIYNVLLIAIFILSAVIPALNIIAYIFACGGLFLLSFAMLIKLEGGFKDKNFKYIVSLWLFFVFYMATMSYFDADAWYALRFSLIGLVVCIAFLLFFAFISVLEKR